MNAIHYVILLWAIAYFLLAYQTNRYEDRLGKLESKLEWKAFRLECKLDECIAVRKE